VCAAPGLAAAIRRHGRSKPLRQESAPDVFIPTLRGGTVKHASVAAGKIARRNVAMASTRHTIISTLLSLQHRHDGQKLVTCAVALYLGCLIYNGWGFFGRTAERRVAP
jgi:hypothetical protein